MRLSIQLHASTDAAVPINHQDLLAGVVYGLIGVSDPEFSRFLHDEGYTLDGGAKRFKLFTFSDLRIPRLRRKIDPATSMLRIGRGSLEWLIASPVEPFLNHLATGLLSTGEIRVGSSSFGVSSVEALAGPAIKETAKFTCLTPMVAGVREPQGSTHYLRPWEEKEFSEAVRNNLTNKYRLLHGTLPQDDRLSLAFDAAYLARARNGGTKKIRYKGIEVIGALAPFTLTGSTELIRLAWECGVGEKNSGGFGMVDMRTANDDGS